MSHSRLFKILYHLLDKGHGIAPELASRFEVSPRTIYRDIEALSGAGIPIYAEPGRNGGIYLLHDQLLDRTVLSEEEKREILTAVQGMGSTGHLVREEIREKLSALFRVDTGDWLEVDLSRWGRSASDQEKFSALKKAVTGHQELRILYVNTRGEKRERTVQPLKLSFRSKEWYLKAFCLEKQDFRMFKLNRILWFKLLDGTFVPRLWPEPVDSLPESCPPDDCPRILLLFARKIAYRIYDEFDETQIACQENGDLLVSARMPQDPWLMGYLLSFGTMVEVIEPIGLREQLAAQARMIYEKNR